MNKNDKTWLSFVDHYKYSDTGIVNIDVDDDDVKRCYQYYLAGFKDALSQPTVDDKAVKAKIDVINLEITTPLSDKELQDLSLANMALLIHESGKLNKLGMLLTRMINTIKAKPQPEIADGYVVVPVEPSEEMIDDAIAEWNDLKVYTSVKDLIVAWDAMIKAAQGEG